MSLSIQNSLPYNDSTAYVTIVPPPHPSISGGPLPLEPVIRSVCERPLVLLPSVVCGLRLADGSCEGKHRISLRPPTRPTNETKHTSLPKFRALFTHLSLTAHHYLAPTGMLAQEYAPMVVLMPVHVLSSWGPEIRFNEVRNTKHHHAPPPPPPPPPPHHNHPPSTTTVFLLVYGRYRPGGSHRGHHRPRGGYIARYRLRRGHPILAGE